MVQDFPRSLDAHWDDQMADLILVGSMLGIADGMSLDVELW